MKLHEIGDFDGSCLFLVGAALSRDKRRQHGATQYSRLEAAPTIIIANILVFILF